MADFTTQEYEEAVLKNDRMSGDMADVIITTLIDNCRDEDAARALPVSKEVWHKLVQKFEEDIRHAVRNIR